jgi:hypothetical protein
MALRCLEQFEIADSLEVSPVSREKGEVMVYRRGRDQDVSVADQLSSAAKISANARKSRQDRPGEGKNLDRS